MEETRGFRARIGELAVYPGQGVTRIEAWQRQELGGQQREFLVLRKLADDSRILIPRERVYEAGLRSVVQQGEVQRIWEILSEGDGGEEPRANPAFRDLQDKLRNGSPFEIAEVLRELLILQTRKDLSWSERKLLDSARSLLVQELAAAQRKTAEQIDSRIRETVR